MGMQCLSSEMGTERGLIMNTIEKIFFWIATILLGLINPLISIALVVVYYLPKIIQDICQPCNEEQESPEMNSFSEDVLEEMK